MKKLPKRLDAPWIGDIKIKGTIYHNVAVYTSPNEYNAPRVGELVMAWDDWPMPEKTKITGHNDDFFQVQCFRHPAFRVVRVSDLEEYP